MRRFASAAGTFLKRTGQGIGLLVGAGAVYTAIDDDSRKAAVRGGRVTKHAIPIAFGYWYTVKQAKEKHGEDSEEYKKILSSVHQMAANHLLALADENGGSFVKFAQAMAMNNSLPIEYIQTLSKTHDKAQAQPWEAVSRVFEEDIGIPPEKVFRSIESEPVASASLAQVHRAVTHDGRDVAVKIQYPNLRYDSRIDLSAIYFYSLLVELIFPQYGYSWYVVYPLAKLVCWMLALLINPAAFITICRLVPDFAASLRNELDFLQEARNGERVAKMFAGNDKIHIPEILGNYSSERVLTMEWISGVKVNDPEGLKSVGVKDTREVAQEVVKFLSQQIFIDGFVHLDLHPGNLFVRRHPDPTKGWQLIPIDWGMVRRLTPAFRHNFADLWVGLTLSDHDRAIRAIQALGMEKSHHEAMSLILVYRPVGIGRRTAALGGKWSEEDVERLKAAKEKIDAMEVNRFMQRLPRDLLFLLRAVNFMRSLNQSLGGTTYERFVTMSTYAVRGLNLPISPLASGPSSAIPADPNSTSYLLSDVKGGSLDDLVSETQDRKASKDPLGATSGALHGLVLWLKQILKREPVREPLTYVNAQAKGNVIDDPTDSEIARKKDEAERQNNPIFYWMITAPTRWAGERKDLAKMQAMLLIQKFVWALLMGGWIGNFKPHNPDPKKDWTKGRDPG
jgi:aarF domain-containing kinase